MAVAVHTEESTRPWWRHGLVWLVIGLPLSAVVAGTITAVIAVRGADPEVERPAVVQQRVDAKDPAAPAVRACNHAATPPRSAP
jgi:uncharacterized protein